MKTQENVDYLKDAKNYINYEKKKLKEALLIKNNHGYRYEMYKGIKKIIIILGLFVLPKI